MSFIVINTNDSGAGSFRQAIIDANVAGSAATITFNIAGTGPHTITPTSALPEITNTVTIDGYSQSGASENTLTTGTDAVLKIVINGSSAGDDVNGLTLASGSDGSTIQGLVIQGFDKRGLLVNSDNHTIRGNYLGTDATGTTAVGNASGIWLGGASNVTVGGSDPGSRNLLSGNADGLYLAGSSNNTVIGNFIGTNASGTAAVGNTFVGIGMGNSANNLIGGSTASDRNLISGNQYGFYLFENNDGTRISGNYIGTDVTGNSAVANTSSGIRGRSNNVTIGGTNAGEGNLISGNGSHGIYLESLSDGDIIQGNYIGTNATGTSALGNGGRGIRVDSANVTIGGSTSGAGNLISGNNNDGIFLASGSDGTVIQGNSIGTTADGTGTIQNNGDGIQVAADNITIGGSNVGEGNTISGNRDHGILVSNNGSDLQVINNDIEDNGDTALDLGGAAATATVTGNDTNPNASISDVTVDEANGTATFTVSLDDESGVAISVDYATVDGTATAGSDYTANSGTLNFAVGETSKSVTVNIIDDGLDEESETFNVTLSNAVNVAIADNQGQATITDNDVSPTLTSIVRQTPTGETTKANSLVFHIAFSENVENVTNDDFEVTGTTATVTNMSGSGALYDITVSGGDLANFNGTVELDVASSNDITDSAGNPLSTTEPTTNQTYTVDNSVAAPSTPDLAASSDSGSSNIDNRTNDTTPTFTGTVEANSTVTLTSSVNGAIGSTTADGLGNWTITASTLTAGNHNIVATATDPAGNTSADSSALAIALDTTAPILSITRQTPTDETTSADSVTFSATFDGAVQNVDATDFEVNGSTSATIASVNSISASEYAITVSGGDLATFNGTVGLDINTTNLNITDLAGNALPGTEPGVDETYTLENIDTTVTLVGGVLTITDSDGGVSSDTLTISYSGGTYTIADAGGLNLGTGITGATGHGTSTVMIPDTGITGIRFDLLDGDDQVTVNSLQSSLTGGFTIDGGAGSDTVTLKSAIATGSGDINVGADVIALTNAADLDASGTGTITLTADQNISLASGTSINVVDGDLTLSANASGTTTGSFKGIDINGGVVQTDGTGNISLTGVGGTTSGSQVGVRLTNGAKVNSTASSGGNITITGTGGDGATNSNQNHGVYVDNGAEVVATSAGAITVQGTGGGGINNAHGVLVSGVGSKIQGNTGHLSVTGTGGSQSGTGIGQGVRLYGHSSGFISTGSGNIEVTGIGIGTQDGIRIQNNTVAEIGGDLATGDITLISDRIGVLSTGGQIQSSGSLTIKPYSASTTIGLGNSTSGTLNLTATELATIQDGFSDITFGDATAGTGAVDISNVTLNDPVTVVGGTIDVTGLNAGANDVTLTARTGAITDGGDGAADVTGATVTLNASGDIGADGNELSLEATDVVTDTSAGNGDQFFGVSTTVPLNQVNTGTGAIEIIINGRFDLTTDAIPDAATIIVNNGATFNVNNATDTLAGIRTGNGGGTIVGIGTLNSPVSIESGGTLAPGNSPGIITMGDLSFTSGATLDMEIFGGFPGTGHDQLVVTGTVDLDDATLNLVVDSAAAVGDTITIIDNDGTDAVVGTFSGLAEGSSITSGDTRFTISYAGGDGNDVVLTVAELTPFDITVSTTTLDVAFAGGTPNIATSSAQNGTLAAADILNNLGLGTSVTLDTEVSRKQSGDIIVDEAIAPTSTGGTPTLAFNAAGDITVNQRITDNDATAGHGLDLNFAATGAVDINANLTTDGAIAIDADGMIDIDADITSGGAIDIDTDGAIDINADITSGGAIAIDADGTIDIDADITSGGAIALSGTGFIDNPDTTLTATSVNFDSELLYTIAIGGTTPGTDYQPLTVIGGVNLDADGVGGLGLAIDFGSFSPTTGDTFTLIDNDGVDAISGTFNGLAEGSVFTIGAQNFKISYMGGDGNDAVLSFFETAPVSIEVDTLVDENDGDLSPGDVSLREAIAYVADGGTITFAAGLAGEEIDLSAALGELDILKSLTIDGDVDNDDTPDITVDAQGNGRVFTIDDRDDRSDRTVAIDGLTLTGGQLTTDNARGAAIYTREEFTLSNSVITGNRITGEDGRGVGIFSEGADVNISHSHLTANNNYGFDGRGAGVAIQYGTLTVTNSSISNNTMVGDRSKGGSFYSYQSSVVLTDSDFSNNTLTGDRNTMGGVFYFKLSNGGNESVTITRSTLSGNRLLPTTEIIGKAGGAFQFNNSTGLASLTITDSVISDNSVTGNYSDGGVAYIRSQNRNAITNVVITGSTISNNSVSGAYADGGAFKNVAAGPDATLNFTITNSTLSGNNVTGSDTSVSGGVFFNQTLSNTSNLTLNLINSTLTNNRVENPTGTGYGGVIANEARNVGETVAINIVNSTLSGNSAKTGGGAIYNSTGPNAGTPGIVSTTITNSTITGNSAGVKGGGIYNKPTDADGDPTTNAQVTVNNSIVAGNTAATNPDVDGVFTSNGSNIIGDTTGSTGFESDNIIGGPVSDVIETTLADNGGPTQTHALVAGSAAIDAGDNSSLPTEADLGADVDGDGTIESTAVSVDQRGGDRVFNTTVDIGAVEAPDTVSLTISDAIATEGADTATFTLSRTATTGDLTVLLDLSGDAATTDYSFSTGTVTSNQLSVVIPNGQSSVDVQVTAVDDPLAEVDETLTLTLATEVTYTIDVANSTSDLTLVSDDIWPTVTSITPTANDIDAADNSAIVITFDDTIDPATATSANITIQGNQTGEIAGNFNVTGSQVTFTPANSFNPGETIAVTVTDAVQSTGGNAANSYTTEFTVDVDPGPVTFLAVTNQPPGESDTREVGLGDLDGDGDLDAFVANVGVANQVLLNDGNGTFTAATDQPPGTGSSTDVSLGDLDGDGDLDAFVANWGQASQVLLNDGNGLFTEATAQPPRIAGSIGVRLGDLDGDGDLDAFVANQSVANQVLLNDGSGIFTDAPTQPPETNDSWIASLGDLDGDGDLDAFVANLSSQANQVLLNDGTGAFVLAATQPPGTANSRDISLGDLDGDGDLDAFVTNDDQGNQVLLNDGNGVFTEATTQPPGAGAVRGVKLGDLDGDGDLDAFVTKRSQANQILLNDGNGNFSNAASQPTETNLSEGLSLGDLDGDGDLDAFVANASNTANRVWLNNNPPPSFTGNAALATVSEDSEDNTLAGVAIVDLDGEDQSVVITVSGGTLSLSNGSSGLTFNGPSMDGVDDSALQFDGSIANVNAALNEFTFTPNTDFSGIATIDIQTTATDGGSDRTTFSITVNDAPEVSNINTTTASLTNADSVSFEVTFSEAVSNVDAGDFALATTGTVGGAIASVTGSGDTYTVTVNTITGDGTLGLNLTDNDTITNGNSVALAGVGITGAGDGSLTGQTYTIDKTAPDAPIVTTLSDDTAIADNITSDRTLAFSGTAETDSTVEVFLNDGTSTISLGTVTATGGNWTFDHTSISLSDRPYTLTATATDAVGNTSNTSADFDFTVDATAPTVTLSTTATDPNNLATIPVTIAFNEGVTDFVVGDITVDNGIASNLNTSDNQTFTVDITPNGDGPVTVDVAAGVAADIAGNPNIVATPLAVESDRTAPTVTSVTPNVTPIDDSAVGTDTFTLTVVFDEDMDTGVNPILSFPTSGENPVNTLTATAGTWNDNRTYVATYTVADANETIPTIDVQVSGAQDIAGNGQTTAPESDIFSINTASAIAFTANSFTVAEDVGTSNVITLTRTGDLSGTATVDVSITGGTASLSNADGSQDYDATHFPLTVTFNPNDTTRTVALPIIDDTLYEPGGNETVTLSLTDITNASLATQTTTTLNITDNDSQPTVTLALADSPLSENGGVATVSALLSNPTTEDVTVNVAFSGTATNTDYTASGTTILIPAGSTRADLTLTGVDDALDEANETVMVDIDSVINAAEDGVQQVVAAIADDDAPVNLSINDVTVNEGDGTATFTVSLDAASGQTITLDYTTVDDSAIAGTDYVPTSGTLTFIPGDTEETLTVSIIDDGLVESSESFTVSLNNETNVTLTNSQATGTLTNNDTYPTVTSIVRAEANPTNETSLDFTVTFDRDVTGVDETDFEIVATDITGASITNVAGTGDTYTVTIDPGTGDGSLRLDLVDDDSIADTFTNVLAGPGDNGDFTGEAYTFDNILPNLISVVRQMPADETTNVDSLTFRVTFSEDVQNVAIADFAVDGTTTAMVSNVTEVNATTYDVTVANGNLADFDGTVGLTLSAAPGLTDLIGNSPSTVVPGTNENYTLDNTPPAVSIPDLSDSSDSGRTNIDDITNQTAPTFTGTAEVGSTVRLSSDVDGVLGSAIADSSGDWSITATTLTEDGHNITATATDTVGNISAPSAALAITIDVTNPDAPTDLDLDAASDTGSSNTDNLTNNTTPTLSGKAEANSIVVLSSDIDGVIGTVTADASGDWTITASPLTEGDHALTATATDTAGNISSASAALAIAIDTTAPTLTIEQATTQTDPTSASPIHFTATFDEAVTGFDENDVTLTGTAGATTSIVTGSDDTYDIAVSGMALAGTVIATVAANTVTDLAGNANTSASTSIDNSVTYYPIGDLIINEIDYDQPGADTAEFIELYNSGTVSLNLDAFRIDLINGANHTISQSIDLPDVDLAAGDYYVISSSSATVTNTDLEAINTIENGDTAPDAIALILTPENVIFDTVSYEGDVTGYTEGSGTLADPADFANTGLSRYTNGTDTNNNAADFIRLGITPGRANEITPNVSLSVTPASVSEEGGPITVTATLDTYTGEDVIVTVALSGTATQNTDYTASPTTITIPAGSLSADITLTPIDDTAFESDETILVDIITVTNGTESGTQQAIATLTNNDAAPTLAITPVTVTEADGTATFTVTLTGETNEIATVDYAITDTSATDGEDYTATTGTLSFNPGETEKTIVVDILENAIAEATETFTVTLSNSVNATIATPTTTGTIADNDSATLSIANATITEGTGGTAQIVFNVTLTGDVDTDVTVDFATTDIAALAGIDYATTSGTLTFDGTDGEVEQITIDVTSDALAELDEDFTVTLSNVQSSGRDVTIAQATATATIEDDDSASLSIANATIVEGTGGTAQIVFNVTLTGEVDTDVTVDFATNDIAALDGIDYTATSGTLTFDGNDGEVKQITIDVTSDALVELDEDFLVTLTNVQANGRDVTIAQATATATIEDDDSASLGIASATIIEGTGGTAQIVFNVTLTGEVDTDVTVDFATSDSAALEGIDYTAASGTLTFDGNDGDVEQITIDVTSDALVELDEDFTVTLSNAQADGRDVTIAQATATATIENDDSAILSIADATILEGTDGTTQLVFDVTLTGEVDSAIALDFTTTDGTAISSASGLGEIDYTAQTGTLNFAGTDGEVQQITIDINPDNWVEADEDFAVTLSNLQANGRDVSIAQATATGTITNDDTTSLAVDDITIVEGIDGTTSGTFTVSLTNPSDFSVTVDVETADDTATTGDSDYVALPTTTLTFAPGETSQPLEVTVNGDLINELDEQFFLNLGNATNATIDDDQGIASIPNDDGTPEIRIADITIPEGDEGTTTAILTITLSNPNSETVTVDLSATDGTADIADYTPLTTSVSFAPGETSQAIDLAITGDRLFETDETLLLTLANAVNGVIATDSATDSATVTITNDDTLDIPTAPEIQAIEDTGVSDSDRLTNITQPTLSGTAEPNGTLEIFNHGISLGTTTANIDGNWSFIPNTPLTDGDHAITVTVMAAGQTTTPSPISRFTVDTMVPTGAIADLAVPIRNTAVDGIQITFEEAIANFDPTDLQLTRDGVLLNLTGVTVTSTDQKNWTVNGLAPLSLDDGTYELTVVNQDITDWAGNKLTTRPSTTWMTGQTAVGHPDIDMTGGRKGLTLNGDKDRNRLIGSPQNDVIRGGKGNDTIISGFGGDLFGRDRLYGDAGNDVLKGGKGNDYLDGGKGKDKLIGGDNHDELIGGQGKDKLIGGSGNDILVGGKGKDIIKGGKGNDTIVFESLKDGIDTVKGFNPDQDLIDLSGIFGAAPYAADNSFAQYVQYVQLEQVGTATHVNVVTDGSATDFTTLARIKGVQADSLSARNFVME